MLENATGQNFEPEKVFYKSATCTSPYAFGITNRLLPGSLEILLSTQDKSRTRSSRGAPVIIALVINPDYHTEYSYHKVLLKWKLLTWKYSK